MKQSKKPPAPITQPLSVVPAMLQVEGDKWNPQNENCWTQLETLEDDRKLLNFETIDRIVDKIYMENARTGSPAQSVWRLDGLPPSTVLY